jgi:arylamine N-acetyltransferase
MGQVEFQRLGWKNILGTRGRLAEEHSDTGAFENLAVLVEVIG